MPVRILMSWSRYFHTTTCRYQVEVPQRLAGRVPSSYKLKSQVKAKKSACQRFHTPRVENLMQELDEAEDARDDKMKCMLQKVCQRICAEYPLFARASGCLATLDVLFSLADVSRAGCGSLPMCRPTIVDAVGGEGGGQTAFEMEGAWHPILASNIDSFIANDTTIGGTRPPCLILTGPNMGGKSTLLRQTAIATIMAQLGCYVPASRVALSPVDRIFTRMGARDNIMMGQSTFMIEMHEAAIVLVSVYARCPACTPSQPPPSLTRPHACSSRRVRVCVCVCHRSITASRQRPLSGAHGRARARHVHLRRRRHRVRNGQGLGAQHSLSVWSPPTTWHGPLMRFGCPHHAPTPLPARCREGHGRVPASCRHGA
jgi:hypothetical protein